MEAVARSERPLVLILGAVLFGISPGPRLPELYLVAALFIAANLAVGRRQRAALDPARVAVVLV